MKSRSLIFIIIAAVLIVAGIITCIVCGSLAKSKNIALLSDTVDKDGNAINSDNIDEYGLTALNIDVEDIDINIIGTKGKSYVEFVNLNPASYDYTVSGYKMTVKTVDPFDIGSLIKIRKNGSGFSGIRSYLFLNKYKDETSKINIYVSEKTVLNEISLKTVNGNISVKNMKNDCLYTLNVKKGDLLISGVETMLETKVKVKDGEYTVSSSSLEKNDFNVDGGNVFFKECGLCQYYITCDNGSIYFDDADQGSSVEGRKYPKKIVTDLLDDASGEENGDEANTEEKTEELETEVEDNALPCEIKGKIVNGNMYVTTKLGE